MFNELLKNVMNLGIITEDDVKRLTAIELMMLIIERTNGLLNHVEIMDAKLARLLENIRTTTVEELNKWAKDGTFNTLINQTALAKVNAQLTEKANKNDVETALTKVNAQLTEKADKDDVIQKGHATLNDFDEETRRIIQGLESGQINAVLGEGNVLTANIQDHAVTPIKTSFLTETTNNLLKYATYEKGKAISEKNGTVITDALYAASDFIKVEPSTTYTHSCNFNIAYYDNTKQFVSGLIGGWGKNGYFTQTTPANAHYMRVTVSSDTTKPRIITKGSKLIANNDYKLEEDFHKSMVKLITDEVSKAHSVQVQSLESFTVETANLLHRVKLIDHAYVDHKNGIQANVTDPSSSLYNYSLTDFVEVEQNIMYCITQQHNIAFYDENKQFLSGVMGGWFNPITVPTSAKYIRITLLKTKEIFMSKGGTLPPISQRGIKLSFTSDEWKNAFNQLLNGVDNPLVGLKWNAMGDSITSTNYSRPNWWEIIASKYDMTVNNYGFSGTTLAHHDERHLWDKDFAKLDAEEIGYKASDSSTWSTGCCFVERFARMEDDVDLITVMGGTNDNAVPLGKWDDTRTDTFYGALNQLFKGLIAKYPDKVIAVFTPIQSANCYKTNVSNPSAELDKKSPTDTISIQLRAEAIKRKASQYGLPCLDLFNMSGISGVEGRKELVYRKDDTLHPSELGNEYMARVIEKFLMTII